MRKFKVQIAALCLLLMTFMTSTVFAAGDIKSIEGISRLKNLESVMLENQGLTSVPDELGNLSNLKTIDLSGNQLTVINNGILSDKSLETLDLSNNQLTSVPDNIDQLVNLTTLSIANNTQITHLPDSMKNMTKLTSIDVSNTGIKCLPLAMEPIAITDKKPAGITYGLTVTYDTQGGNAIDSVRVDQDQLIPSVPAEPVKNGFTFGGWFSDSSCTKAWDFATNTVPDHMTLYAKWNGKPSVIQFEENWGTGVTDLTGVTDQTIADRNMPTISRDGYTFDGWFTDSGFTGAAVTQLPDKYPVSGITYFAKWTANASNIAFAENGGADLTDLSGVTDQVISFRDMPPITRIGYAFGGWFTDSGFSGAAVTQLPDKYPVTGIIYYAKWSPEPSTITFDESNGSLTPDLVGATDQPIINRDMPTSTRDGYTFDGWYTDANGAGTKITQLPDKYPVSGITYFAKWTANPSTISFEENSGSTVSDMNGVTDQTIGDRNMPTISRDGYTFGGWFADSGCTGTVVTQLPATYPVAGIMYYAKWTANVSTISFAENEGSVTADLTGVTDQTISDRTMPVITRNGYTFAGWFADSGFSGAEVTQLPAVYPVTGITYYAKWTSDASTIIFEENSGSNASDMTGVTDQTIVDRTMPVIIRSGYTFEGWFADSGFTGAAISQLPDKYPVGSITYHAKWSANVSSIIFTENGGSAATDLTGVTDQTIADRTMPIITRSGYTFIGWYAAADFSGAAVTQLPESYPVSGITYYAKWNANASNITFIENGGTPAATDLGGTTDQTISNRTMPTVSKSGYTFGGWFADSGCTGTVVTQLPATYPVGGAVFYAKWTANAASIKFVTNSGTAIADMTGVTDQVISPTTMPSTTRTGYTLFRWYTDSGFTSPVVTSLPAAYPVGTTTYYAKWTINTYNVTFESNGGTAVAPTTATYNTTVSAPTEPTKANAFFDSWCADAALTIPWDFANNKITADTTLYAKWTDLPPAGQPLESYTWEQIKLISNAGKGDLYFNVGDEKIVNISGTNYTFQIYGFDHDDKADGSGKANITFGMKGVLATTHYINPTNTNYYGWVGSDMRAWLNGVYTTNQNQDYTTGTTSIWSQLPAELKAQITPVKKYTSGGYNDQTLKTSTDNLFLFSEKEAFGTNTYTLAGEGTQYPIFTTDASRVKTYPNSSTAWWWLRSPYYNSDDDFVGVNNIGGYNGSNAGNSYGVAFGFSI